MMAQSFEPILLDPVGHCSLSVQEPLMKIDVVPQVRHLFFSCTVRATVLARAVPSSFASRRLRTPIGAASALLGQDGYGS